jgi:peptidoglycan/xylan/chitin deacetylase (PgdA/CDA1 family)
MGGICPPGKPIRRNPRSALFAQSVLAFARIGCLLIPLLVDIPPRFCALLVVAACLGWSPARAAYLIEVDSDGRDDGHLAYSPDFAFGGNTTGATQSVAATAIGLGGGDSIFGGNGNHPDTYLYTYRPDAQADNCYLDPGTPLGNGHSASGAAGGGPGRYAVFAAWPASTNVGGGLTRYRIDTAGASATFAADQNTSGNTWVKIGEIDYVSGAITVTQTPTVDHYVSMRAAGVLFERQSAGAPAGYEGPPGPVVFGTGAASTFGLAFRRDIAAARTTHFMVLQSPDCVTWSSSDLKLVSVNPLDAATELVAFRSMVPTAGRQRQFLKVQPVAKMPLGEPPQFVAMTFDDGPHPDRTPRLLDLLAARNIRATFYVIGANARKYPQIIRRMLNEGHEIGNHSQNHPRLTDLTETAVIAELAGCRDAVVAAATLPPATMRPPYGAVDDSLRALFLSEFGYPTILWDVDPRDWDANVSDAQVLATILNQASHGDIILAHDIHERTITIMPDALDGLRARGFAFVTVSELLEWQGP